MKITDVTKKYHCDTVTYQELYRWGLEELARADIGEAGQDARLLLEWCCGTDRNTLLAHGDREMSLEEVQKYAQCMAQRKEHVPLQYITGEQNFMGLSFAVDRNVLVPRQDTEVLVEEVMRYLHDGMNILDMCTGTGCILLSLLHYSNDCTGVGVDVSGEALRIARENTERLLSAEPGDRVAFVQSDLFDEVDNGEKFDIIVSNPPYIKTGVIGTLMPEVRDYEPRLALDGREDGLFFYRRIIEQAGEYLAGGGMLFFEIGCDQGEEVRRLMENAGYREVEIVKDFAGLDRVVHGIYVGTIRR